MWRWPLLRRAEAALLVFVDVMKELPATLVLVGLVPVMLLSRTLRQR